MTATGERRGDTHDDYHDDAAEEASGPDDDKVSSSNAGNSVTASATGYDHDGDYDDDAALGRQGDDHVDSRQDDCDDTRQGGRHDGTISVPGSVGLGTDVAGDSASGGRRS